MVALMTTPQPWPRELTRLTGKEVRRYRRERGMSTDQFAAAVTELGLRYSRSQVTNLEAGRRDSITNGELIAFGRVLNVPPLILMFPVGHVAEVELVPHSAVATWEALRWFTGEPPQTFSRGKADPWLAAAEPLRQHRQHQRLMDDLDRHERRRVSAFLVKMTPADQEPPSPVELAAAEELMKSEERAAREVEAQLTELRQQMRERGYQAPPLPELRAYLDTGDEQ